MTSTSPSARDSVVDAGPRARAGVRRYLGPISTLTAAMRTVDYRRGRGSQSTRLGSRRAQPADHGERSGKSRRCVDQRGVALARLAELAGTTRDAAAGWRRRRQSIGQGRALVVARQRVSRSMPADRAVGRHGAVGRAGPRSPQRFRAGASAVWCMRATWSCRRTRRDSISWPTTSRRRSMRCTPPASTRRARRPATSSRRRPPSPAPPRRWRWTSAVAADSEPRGRIGHGRGRRQRDGPRAGGAARRARDVGRDRDGGRIVGAARLSASAATWRAPARRPTSHTQIVNQLQQLRTQASGVSLDEEAAHLMRYQRAYEASARYFSTIVERSIPSWRWCADESDLTTCFATD